MLFPMRINKYIAEQGWASRREADALIVRGAVRVNGHPAVIGQQITADDAVTLSKTPTPKRYFAYHKPRGVITHSPGPGEVDIASKLQAEYDIRGVAPLGRLDKDSEGLILLSDDGRVTKKLLDPAAGHEKEYVVRVDKPVNKWFFRHMANGVAIEGYTTKPAHIVPDKKYSDRFYLTLTEGKKHQIRRMCAALGYQVHTIRRTRILNIKLEQQKAGELRELRPKERTAFLNALGITTH